MHVQYSQRSAVCALPYTCLYVCVCVYRPHQCSLVHSMLEQLLRPSCSVRHTLPASRSTNLPYPTPCCTVSGIVHTSLPPSVSLHPYSPPSLVIHMDTDTGTEWVRVVCWPNLLPIYVFIGIGIYTCKLSI